jgi:PAS domain S-box-containing protein
MTKQPEARILLVDDDETKRYTIAKPLERAGFELQQASSGADALRMVASLPDLVILDVKLPDLSGFEVCRRIKSDPNTASIPILHVSSTFVDIEDKVHGLDCGADGYLTNVAEPLELIATVRALLRARKAEDAAQLSTRQWQTTFDAISDGAMLLDSVGMVVQVNRTLERILERPWVELIGKDVATLWNGREGPEESLFSKMLASRDREATDLSLGERWLHVTLDPVRDASGVIKGALCLISDITDRKRMEMQLLRQAERLQEASQRKDEFLAMLAHELRNPLAPLSHTLEIIHLQTKGNQLIEDSVVVAKRQIQHMARLLEDLLDVSRITRGKVDLRKKPVDFKTIVEHAVETILPMIESLNHELTVVLPETPISVNGDPTRLEQIVSNLLTNAAKYTESGGRINVSLASHDGRAVLKVKDNGIGISAELRHQIFDLFVQADHSLDRAHGGLGIGLTLVRSLVELHDGDTSVYSAGPGQGSEFTLRIPLIKGAPAQAPAVAPSLPHAPARPMRILVADDNRDSARTLAKFLELRGDQVFCTFDGPSTIEFVTQNEPDAVLLDIGLPGMDGYQVAEKLRTRWSSDRLKLIAVTGYGGDADLHRGRSSGFDHYLVKPLDLDTLDKALAPRHVTG